MEQGVLPQINMGAFVYDLPDDRIAKYPLPQRDQSRLLVWDGHHIEHQRFFEVAQLLSDQDLLFFNNTKVIPARLFFRKTTGALIEVFLLSPIAPQVVDMAMQQTAQCDWACTIGNLKAWKKGIPLEQSIQVDGSETILRAELLDQQQMHVRFSWDGGHSLVSVLEAMGHIPIPPYLQRAAEDSDRTNYQTVYSKKEGAVAAPTAGLHFTPQLLQQIQEKGIGLQEVTLHVSSGTFRPVKVENAIDHDMHFEQVVIKKSSIEALLSGKRIVCVGTTALRTLESLYWFGAKLAAQPNSDFLIQKTDAYTVPPVPLQESIQQVMDYMNRRGATEIHGNTQLYIMPGYTFRVCDALITNFHQPGSTLLLLVAAFVGNEVWKQIYASAMENGYRFLSYGDSSWLALDKHHHHRT